MIEVPTRQICACGNGCDGRSSVKWNGYLVVTCVPDDEAMGVVEAIMESARRSIVEERAAVVAWLREYEGHSSLAMMGLRRLRVRREEAGGSD